MAITRMCPNSLHLKEFFGGYHGTCGETALATAMACSLAGETHDEAVALMLAITKEMITEKWADATGATTTQRLHDEAIKRGFPVDEHTFIGYHEPLDPAMLHPLLLSTAGVKPIILEIAKASALPGDEAGVHYHFICIVGICPLGYYVNDGDNQDAEQKLVLYSWATLEAAVPCGVLVVGYKAPPSTVPHGWTDDAATKTLTAPNHGAVPEPYRSFILAAPGGWDPSNTPVTPPLPNPLAKGGTIQLFHDAALHAQPGVAVTNVSLTSEVATAYHAYADLLLAAHGLETAIETALTTADKDIPQ